MSGGASEGGVPSGFCCLYDEALLPLPPPPKWNGKLARPLNALPCDLPMSFSTEPFLLWANASAFRILPGGEGGMKVAGLFALLG